VVEEWHQERLVVEKAALGEVCGGRVAPGDVSGGKVALGEVSDGNMALGEVCCGKGDTRGVL